MRHTHTSHPSLQSPCFLLLLLLLPLLLLPTANALIAGHLVASRTLLRLFLAFPSLDCISLRAFLRAIFDPRS